MSWQALVPPRPWVTDGAGFCLRYAQSFFGAPARHRSAWHAWAAAPYRHGIGDPLPGVPVLLWFAHWGEYFDGLGQYGDDPSRPYYGNWGHVAIHVPGDAIYTSPGYGWGFERWATIGQIEARFGCRYVGWSEGINGLLVAQYIPAPTPIPAPIPDPDPEEDDDMWKPTVHVRTSPTTEFTLAHPEIGPDLAQYTGPGHDDTHKRREGKITVFRGFMVTEDPEIGKAWARMYAHGSGKETSRTNRTDYIAIQVEASRLASEITVRGARP